MVTSANKAVIKVHRCSDNVSVVCIRF
jgi:hypothetical protein